MASCCNVHNGILNPPASWCSVHFVPFQLGLAFPQGFRPELRPLHAKWAGDWLDQPDRNGALLAWSKSKHRCFFGERSGFHSTGFSLLLQLSIGAVACMIGLRALACMGKILKCRALRAQHITSSYGLWDISLLFGVSIGSIAAPYFEMSTKCRLATMKEKQDTEGRLHPFSAYLYNQHTCTCVHAADSHLLVYHPGHVSLCACCAVGHLAPLSHR